MDEIRERFRNLKVEVLEDIVRNQKDDYTDEAYSIAVEELRVQTSGEYVDDILREVFFDEKEKVKVEEEKRKNLSIKGISIAAYLFVPWIILCNILAVTNNFWFIISLLAAIEVEILLIKKKKFAINWTIYFTVIVSILNILFFDIFALVLYLIFGGTLISYLEKRKHLLND